MSKQTNFGELSESRFLLDQLADKWSIVVMAAISPKPAKFNEVRIAATGIAHDALTQCLRRLERNGLITKTVLQTDPVSTEYAITALGTSLMVPYAALNAWSETNLPAVNHAQLRFDDFQKQKKHSK
jgi:DNA-binding HxlR family transcriptional regulator